MLDQSRIQSGFDVEILLGERQISYLLLALVDAGRIPITFAVGDPPVMLGLRLPQMVDRTYEPHPDAPSVSTALDSLFPMQVEVLFGHQFDAYIRVHVVIDLGGLPVEGDLFVALTFDTASDDDGMLENATLHVELRDIESGILPFVFSEYGVDKATILATLKTVVDRDVDLGGVGTFKRIQQLAFRTHESDGVHPNALGLYVNLRLRDDPDPDGFLPTRGDASAALNFLPSGSDSAMATRPGLYAHLAADSFHRFAEIDENGAVIGLGAGAFALGIIGGSLADFVGHLIVDEIYSGRVEKKVDAALPDVISGRVEVTQRRWDPLYTTFHQIAMRPDGALVNGSGVALWGRAVLDREVKPVAHAVIRDKQATSPNPPTHLRYRVRDADDFREDFDAIAPGTDRLPSMQHDATGEPTLFQLSIEQIAERLEAGRIVPNLAYFAKRVDMRQNQVHSILTISQRERNETRNALIRAFEQSTASQIDTDEGAQIRMDVAAEFAAAGVTPTQEELDARVQEVIDERVAPLAEQYVDGPLGSDLEQALLPLLRFDLPPEYLAALQEQKILHLLDLEMITMRAPGHQGFRYYRDKPDFHTPDNLHSLPRYKTTPNGPDLS